MEELANLLILLAELNLNIGKKAALRVSITVTGTVGIPMLPLGSVIHDELSFWAVRTGKLKAAVLLTATGASLGLALFLIKNFVDRTEEVAAPLV